MAKLSKSQDHLDAINIWIQYDETTVENKLETPVECYKRLRQNIKDNFNKTWMLTPDQEAAFRLWETNLDTFYPFGVPTRTEIFEAAPERVYHILGI